MHTYGEAFYDLKKNLQSVYDEREAAAIAHELLNHVTGLNKLDRLMQKDTELTDQQEIKYAAAAQKLLAGVPMQYVIGIAWFMEREFEVNEHVLIPRPETEELVYWIVQDYKGNDKIDILDIGTGSGVIPVSLKLAMPDATVSAIDISEQALEVAARNAEWHHAEIAFAGMDILDPEQQNNTGIYDVIVSNPPYIPLSEKENMHVNVKDHEPSLALFVPSDDPQLFYRAIAQYGKSHLKAGGVIYCEVEATQGPETKRVFEQMGYGKVELRKDMHDNWRMLKATDIS